MMNSGEDSEFWTAAAISMSAQGFLRLTDSELAQASGKIRLLVFGAKAIGTPTCALDCEPYAQQSTSLLTETSVPVIT